MYLKDIHIRDPFVLVSKEHRLYYMYGTIGETAWGGKAGGFNAYTSKDLNVWEGPFQVFCPAPDFWADHHFWAPEVHFYQGKYYMFASFKAEGRCRATQILIADNPLGPFIPHGAGLATPEDWECLDGTLHVDQEGVPWMVFCHEWTQIGDGEICAVLLTAGMDAAAGEPITLFKASEASWVTAAEGEGNYVTDGPFLFQTAEGELQMIWSSFSSTGYAIGAAKSATGRVQGPWIQESRPLFTKNGGHGMLFENFQGQRMLSIHMPNDHPDERPVFFPVQEKDGQLHLSVGS